ncbi:MAG: cell division protein FtsA [Chitinophagales bacterium]|nr:cell division protein FtsA [Chitinophagales bacterium]MDW8418841.1 cell division protein FtsA [Chitinophagales bacterium]
MSTDQQNPVIVGLDIGTTKIACIVARRDQYGKLHILGLGRVPSHGVQRGEVSNIKLTTDAIVEAVALAEKESGHKITSVFVGIAGQHISSKQSRDIYTLPNPEEEITQQDVRAMIQNMYRIALEPGERIITVLPQEFRVDNYQSTNNPVGMCGSRLEADFHIITGKVTAAQYIKKCVERAGLKMAGLFLEPLASSAAVLHPDELEAGVVLVDIGGGTTDVAIFKNNIIRHTAIIPYAGNIITEDIMEGCKLLKPQAEYIKTTFGSALPGEIKDNEIISIPGIAGRDRREIQLRTLASIIHARMEEILALVAIEIRNSHLANKLNAGIVITGGGSQLKHLKQLTEYVTHLSARIGQPAPYLAKGNKTEYNHPMYATGIGLILEGYREFDSMDSEKRREFFPELFTEPEPMPQPTLHTVYERTEIPEEEATGSAPDAGGATPAPQPGKTSKNFLQNMARYFKNWFEDEDVNGDFE